MPNTLVHIGINGFLSKSISKKYNLFWIYLGCIIPDIPWISKKFFELFVPHLNGYDLQAYLIIQATLFSSLILSFTFSLLSKNLIRTFSILSLGSILHLLADSFEIKWANGVHLFAPFNWELINFGIIWPENTIIHLLGLAGLVFFIFNWKNIKYDNFDFFMSKSRLIYFSIMMLIYLLLPLLFQNQVYNSDNHFIKTLKNQNSRLGKYVEFDRKKIVFNEETKSYWIASFNNDLIELENVDNLVSSKISLKGKFINNDLINVIEYKENLGMIRDGASYIGLLLIFIFNIRIFIKNKFTN
ncbi:MAG: hypothetical protein WAR79_03535 [Melioribacteraceae bacterium]